MSGDHARPVAVVIPAKDESARIASTIRAASAIPGVDLVVVVDDGSRDDTQSIAHGAGAVVARHTRNRGKAAALQTGAAVVERRDEHEGRGRPGDCCCSSTRTSRTPPPRWGRSCRPWPAARPTSLSRSCPRSAPPVEAGGSWCGWLVRASGR